MNIDSKEKVKKGLGYCWTFFQVIIVIYVIFMTLFILFKNQYGYTQFGGYTLYNVDADGEKNNKGFIKGDLVSIKSVDDIKEGDLIYYYTVVDESYVIKSSEVTRIEKGDDNCFYTVYGDSVSVADKKVIGKNATIFPHVGTLLTIVCSKFGFMFLVLLPIVIVFAYQIYDFIKITRKEKKEQLFNSSEQNKDDKIISDNSEEEIKLNIDDNKIEQKEEDKKTTDNSEKIKTININEKKELYDDEIL